jgi:hypothetical protein
LILLALLILLRATVLFLVRVGLLFGLIFADADRFAGHIARIVVELSRVLFARLLLVGIPVVGHGRLLGFITLTASTEVSSSRLTQGKIALLSLRLGLFRQFPPLACHFGNVDAGPRHDYSLHAFLISGRQDWFRVFRSLAPVQR